MSGLPGNIAGFPVIRFPPWRAYCVARDVLKSTSNRFNEWRRAEGRRARDRAANGSATYGVYEASSETAIQDAAKASGAPYVSIAVIPGTLYSY